MLPFYPLKGEQANDTAEPFHRGVVCKIQSGQKGPREVEGILFLFKGLTKDSSERSSQYTYTLDYHNGNGWSCCEEFYSKVVKIVLKGFNTNTK